MHLEGDSFFNNRDQKLPSLKGRGCFTELANEQIQAIP